MKMLKEKNADDQSSCGFSEYKGLDSAKRKALRKVKRDLLS